MHKTIELSDAFKAQTSKAIFSIVLFVFVYLSMVVAGVFLAIGCVYFGIMIIFTTPRLLTILLGVGVASMGVLVLFFLIKFLFKSHKVDRSHLIEIHREDQPELFALIDEIVNKVDTTFPKKVYLSDDINAAVFYDSSFWSMFLPIRKNLQVGLGLTNSVTKDELRAILAHEFGHFSQDSMKVGSYVYNDNQVIFNMLYDNEGYDRILTNWASISELFALFAVLAIKIIEGIQWILQQMYGYVNISYMGLSREMEFHADEIAAYVAGSKPLQTSLLRLSLAEHALNAVLGYYQEKIKENIKSPNIYPEQAHVMKVIAMDDQISLKYGLPQVELEDLNRYNKSKLVISDQWASHPSTEDRVKRLERLGVTKESTGTASANEYFRNISALQVQFTSNMFTAVSFKGEIKENEIAEFIVDYKKQYQNNSFPKCFNGYYDHKDPLPIDLDKNMSGNELLDLRNIFTEEKVDLIYVQMALENDMKTIQQIDENMLKIKTFDYAGRKYRQRDSNELLRQLDEDLQKTIRNLQQQDEDIYHFFLGKEQQKGDSSRLRLMYKEFVDSCASYNESQVFIQTLKTELDFLNYATPFEEIRKNFILINRYEVTLKKKIKALINKNDFVLHSDEVVLKNFTQYLSKDWVYFRGEQYYDDCLDILFTAISNYQFVIDKQFFYDKKTLLEYMANLVDE